MKNQQVAKLLNNIASILELQGVQWKPQAYRKAAQSIETLAEDIEDIVQKGTLRDIPGIGEHIAAKIEEFLDTGKLKYYEELKKKVKVDIEQLSGIPNLGPKKIKFLYQKLGVKTLADLEKAVQQHTIQKLKGFGEKTEKMLEEGISFVKTNPRRFLYAQAVPIVNKILASLGKLSYVEKMEIAGSFRRGKETVGDLDFLAISNTPEKVMKAFISLPDVSDVLAKGMTKSSIRLTNGLQVDLRVLNKKEFGSALLYFIGNKEHNVEIRRLALSKGYTLSEYGLFAVKGKKWIAGRTEQEVYDKLGLQYLEPELRENMGELSAAQKDKLPSLLELKDINGVFHNHSTWSDGANSLLEMAEKAEALKLKFISFNDHFAPMGIVNPLDEKKLVQYLAEIEKVRKKVGIRVFSGVEIDIMKNGTLPLPSSKLKQLDVVVASVHLATRMPEAEMTKRVCNALEKYPVNILGHPNDRILNGRDSIALNFDTVYDVAKRRNVFLEINGSPQRMDLPGEQVKFGLDAGCKFALSTDGHEVHQLENYKYALLMARRGWLEKKDVLNCWSLPKMEKALRK